MMSLLPAPLRGTITALLLVANLAFWIIPMYVIAVIKLLPGKALSVRCLAGLERVAALWISGNNAIAALHDLKWDVRGQEGLSMDGWYLVASNHRSWIDVFALQYAFNRRIPFLRFFLKKQLIWVPLLGLAWWAMELPFMRRHSRAKLDKNPELRQQDLEETRRACKSCRERPTTIMNFLEGTRFTEEKKLAQDSPYKHLLRPKIGGLAFAVAAVGPVMKTFLDVTLVYSKLDATLWDMVCGRVDRVIIDIQRSELPASLLEGDYAGDAEYRARFKEWGLALWEAKDKRIESLSRS